jgi:hypothetical protein
LAEVERRCAELERSRADLEAKVELELVDGAPQSPAFERELQRSVGYVSATARARRSLISIATNSSRVNDRVPGHVAAFSVRQLYRV